MRAVVQALQLAGLSPTLGGSGLLHAHDLVETVRDWDLLVDAEVGAVTSALGQAGLAWTEAADRTGPYATAGRFLLDVEDVDIDLMVAFAIWPAGVPRDRPSVRIPSLASGSWNGLPLGSLEAWLVAYRLMDRPLKPDRIHEHLARTGADRSHLERMRAEPLPGAIRAELERLRDARIRT